ncbi:MAG TPA: 4-(cytidine 5'-diphospho)-2-C-methyl-D-erythritol kinase [Steroidobacteraceae bacterium]|nr:4-(cytidine 5'-diphospho)-2-C-methyl-D-erythritol kinase [Steroidobacteraceae bacterium]
MSAEPTWWPAPAKLNLFLHVVGRRPDGYHELQTLFQLIELTDRIGLRPRQDGAIERRSGMAEVAPEHDLAVRAARTLQRHTGVTLGADLHVIKHIPAGGGLGGGSSDAATVLLGLNRLWDTQLGIDELAGLALPLGADVPLFVRGASAWGEGRGERLQPMTLPQRWFLVIHPGVAVSTAEIFQAPELTRNSSLITIRAAAADQTRNDCEPVVRARYPEVAAALDWLDAQMPTQVARPGARLTGTGACIFASFEREQDARLIAQRVPARWSSLVARGLDRSPLHVQLDAG